MADRQEAREQQNIRPSPTSGGNDNPPRRPAPIPLRHSNTHHLFVALLGLVLLLSVGIGGIWLSRVQHPQPRVQLPPATGTATSPELLATAQPFLCASGSLIVSGSTTLQPVVARVARDYTARCSQARITVQDGGSSPGLEQLEQGTVDMAMTDVPASPAQAPRPLVDHPLVVVLFTVIVNTDVGVTTLTTAQLQEIYTSRVTNWRQVGGRNLPIVVVDHPTTSSIRAIFERYVLHQHEQLPSVDLPPSNSVAAVSATSGAIGNALLSQIPVGSQAQIIAIDGDQPTFSNVEHNAYPFWNVEHLYTKGSPTPLAQALLDSLDSPFETAETAFFCLPRSLIQPSALAAHNEIPPPA